MTELEALKAELKKSQDEVEKLHIDVSINHLGAHCLSCCIYGCLMGVHHINVFVCCI